MSNDRTNVLTEEFLMDMYRTAFENEYVLAIMMNHIKQDYLPDRDFIALHRHLAAYYKEYGKAPTYSVLKQKLADNKGARILLDDIYETASEIETDELLKQMEEYIVQTKFKKVYSEVGRLYNEQGHEEADKKLQEYVDWRATFNLCSSEFVDVISTFKLRFKDNRQRFNQANTTKPINRFYIDDLDVLNGGRDLRTQLTCFMASTGVGKSHIARWIGKNACQIDGLNVLHFQLEGSEKEVTNAYSASLVNCETFRYESGTLKDVDVDMMTEQLNAISGKLFVRAYPKFNASVSTIDIKNTIQKFKKTYKISPDVVIIDSGDLLNDASGRRWGENGERHKRVAVFTDLKDLATDENVWMVVTYQSTIESRDWLNDENNVLSIFNCAEAKGISRPLTHLITLNRSEREENEETMRIYVAKARFFKKQKEGRLFRIATNYDKEQFYDADRTMRLNKIAR